MFMNNENVENNAPKNKVGRHRLVMLWPEDRFTVQSVHDSTGISKITLYNKIKDDLKSNLIETCGQEKSQGGRPRVVYRKKVTPSVVGSSLPENTNPILSSMVTA